MNARRSASAHGSRSLSLGLAMLTLAACTDAPARGDSTAADGGIGGGAPDAPATPSRRGSRLLFDPATVKVGDTVGNLRVAHVDVALAAGDMGYVGDVRFDGELTIAGERMNHPDFPDVKEICMSVDSAHAELLPGFPADERRRWLCFENRDEAARQLGEAGTRGGLTVVIARYQTVRHFTDAYDTATLVRVVDDRRER